MKYFRCNIIRITTAVLIIVVFCGVVTLKNIIEAIIGQKIIDESDAVVNLLADIHEKLTKQAM